MFCLVNSWQRFSSILQAFSSLSLLFSLLGRIILFDVTSHQFFL